MNFAGEGIAEGRRWRRAAGALVVLLALAWGGWCWWAGRPERHLEQAEAWLRSGQPALAEAWLELPETTPRTAERAGLLRARIALDRGRPRDAVAPLERIRTDGPLAAEAAYWKGQALLAAGNLPHALAWFQRSLRLRPDDPDALRAMAVAAYDLGDLETVLRALQSLTRLRPDDAAAWRTLGLVRLEMPDAGEQALETAARAYQTSLDLKPNQPKARLELADVLMQQGHFAEAEQQLDACRDRVPEADRASLLARAAWGRGDLERVRQLLDDALAQAPDHPALLAQRGLLAQADGRFAEAVDWFDRAIAADPYDSQRYHQRATALRALGRFDEAEQDARRAADLKQAVVDMSALNAEATDHPLDPGVRCRLGQLCERLGKPELAASWYRAALACDPRNREAGSALAALRRR